MVSARISLAKAIFEAGVILVLCISQASFTLGTPPARQHMRCSQTSGPCLLTQVGATVRDTCSSDADCAAGSRCCFRGCARSCVPWKPCDAVVCNQGYTCSTRFTFLLTRGQWIPEASCLPDEEQLCPSLRCENQGVCPPGYRTTLDSDGCRTCQCEPKPACMESSCRRLCRYGKEMGPDGCPLCRCKRAPASPCSDVHCAANEECRLTVSPDCTSQPCTPKPRCLPRQRSQFENLCSSWDDTTVQMPVMTQACRHGNGSDVSGGASRWCEVNCLLDTCPDRTVCVTMGRVQNRCCWQSTQSMLLPSPKPGQCPPDVLLVETASPSSTRRRQRQRCIMDAQCPGHQKCCSSDVINSQAAATSTRTTTTTTTNNNNNTNNNDNDVSIWDTFHIASLSTKERNAINATSFDNSYDPPRNATDDVSDDVMKDGGATAEPATAGRGELSDQMLEAEVVEVPEPVVGDRGKLSDQMLKAEVAYVPTKRSTQVYGYCLEPTHRILSRLAAQMPPIV